MNARPVLVNLPPADLSGLLPACEILCQEGFTHWSLPVDRIDELAALRAGFGRRSWVGIHGVTDTDQMLRGAEAGAAWVSTDLLLPRLVGAVSGLPVILGGLTPTELQAGLDAGAAAVALRPAEAFGADYPPAVAAMLGHPALLVAGRVKRARAAHWLDSGILAVWPDVFIEDYFATDSELGALRAEIQLWRVDD